MIVKESHCIELRRSVFYLDLCSSCLCPRLKKRLYQKSKKPMIVKESHRIESRHSCLLSRSLFLLPLPVSLPVALSLFVLSVLSLSFLVCLSQVLLFSLPLLIFILTVSRSLIPPCEAFCRALLWTSPLLFVKPHLPLLPA